MKIQGKVKTILAERTVSDGTKEIRKQDFIVEIPKPNNTDRVADTISLTRCGKLIDEIDLIVGKTYTFLYDSNARVSADGTGNEAYCRTNVFIIDEKE